MYAFQECILHDWVFFVRRRHKLVLLTTFRIPLYYPTFLIGSSRSLRVCWRRRRQGYIYDGGQRRNNRYWYNFYFLFEFAFSIILADKNSVSFIHAKTFSTFSPIRPNGELVSKTLKKIIFDLLITSFANLFIRSKVITRD